MTAIPTVVAAESKAAVPVPLDGLSPAARKAVDTDPAEIVRRWIGGLGDSIRRKYRQAARDFCGWALHQQDAKPEDALRVLLQAGAGRGDQLLVGFREHLLGRGLSTGTVAGLIAGLCSLVGACRQAGLTTWRPEKVAPRVEKRQDRSGPQRFEVEQIVQHVDGRAAEGDAVAVRDAAILRLLYVAALRRAEVVGLRLQDVDLDHQDGPRVHPRRKGRREREPVLVGRRAGDALRTWLALRDTGGGPLFTRLDQGQERGAALPLSGEAVRRLVARRARQAGVGRPVRPHGLRHSSATEVARRGSLSNLKALGGWASLSAVTHYLDERNEERQQALGLVEL